MSKHEIDVTYNKLRPKIKLEPSECCDIPVFLDAIRKHLKEHQDNSKPEHVNLVLNDQTIKRCKQFYNDMIVVQTTIKSLYSTPVLLSAFICGLSEVYPIVSDVINLNGSYKVDNINNVLNEHLL